VVHSILLVVVVPVDIRPLAALLVLVVLAVVE
jgi:hypothetical protein